MTRKQRNKIWTAQELEKLKMLFPKSPREELEKEFPDRSWTSVRLKAAELKLNRHPDAPKIKKPVNIPGASNLNEEERQVVEYLSKHDTVTVSDIAKLLDKSELGIVQILFSLRSKGFDILHNRASKSVQLVRSGGAQAPLPIDVKDNVGIYRFAVICETRLGHRNQQLTLLHTVYKFIEKLGVDFVLHGGNLVAGYQPKRHREEVFLEDAEDQKDYAVQHYPKSKNFHTYIIAGQTDLSFKTKGSYNILRAICQEREDLIYRGDETAQFLIRQVFEQELIHPSTDNVPYAKTYTFQRILEQILAKLETIPAANQGGRRPDMVLAGGYHTPGLLPAYSDIDGFLLPSFISQTPRQKRKGIAPTAGFWVIEVIFNQKGELENVKPTLYDWTHYQLKQDYLEDPSGRGFDKFTEDEKAVLEILAEGPQSYGEISRRLDRNKETILKIVDRLMNQRKLEISIPSDTKQVTWDRKLKTDFIPLADEVMKKMFVKSVKLASVSDTHLCSNHQQISILRKAYQVGDAEKVDVFIHTGDVSDGAGAVGYRSHGKDVFIFGYTDQLEYLIKNYPKSNTGKKTKIIPGNHDWWDFESFGGDIVKEFCGVRTDLEYGEYPRCNFEINGFRIQLFHPGGGSAYALSYQIQKHILSQIRNKEPKVDVIFFGNWHKALYLLYAGVHGFLAPSMKNHDEFHQKLGLPNAVGMWIVELTKDESGRITRVVPDYRDFSHLLKEKDFV